MAKYSEYKASNIPWVNEIPSHWKVTKAKRLWKKEQREVRLEDDIVTAFRDGTVTLRKNRREDGFTVSLKEIGYQGIRKGDLVIHQMDAFAGAIGVSDSDGKCTPVYSVCTPIHDANPYYYNYLLREMSRSKFILSLAKGIRERSSDFRFDMFGELEVPVPPLTEQKAIVKFIKYKLSKIQVFINKKRKLIKLLKEQKSAMVNKAITKGINDRLEMKSSGIDWLGEVPQHWEIKRLKYICYLQRGHDLSKNEFVAGSIPVYGSNGIIGYHYTATTNAPNITVGRSGSVGKVNFINQDFWAHNTALYVKESYGNNWKYLYYLLNTIDIAMVSSGSAVPTLDRKNVHRLYVAYPSISEQKLIVEYIEEEVTKLDAAIGKIEKEILLVEEYRTALIAEAITGKIDVGNYAFEIKLESVEA